MPPAGLLQLARVDPRPHPEVRLRRVVPRLQVIEVPRAGLAARDDLRQRVGFHFTLLVGESAERGVE
jgi:hypothetical protein